MKDHPAGALMPFEGAAYDVVGLAASAGGLHALGELLAQLPQHFPAALVVVQHLDPHHRSMMVEILARRISLDIKQAEEGDVLRAGLVFIAPPNRHLLINPDGTLSLSLAELVHFVRPSADLLFESLAGSYRRRAIGVVLSGAGSDGATGLRAIHKMGGIVIVQDPRTAEFSSMPAAAAETGVADLVLPLADIAPALIGLVCGGGNK